MSRGSSILAFACLFSLNAFADIYFPIDLEEYQNRGSIVVPAGNASQAQARGFDGARYRRALAIMLKRENLCEIKTAAELYRIDPVSIMGDIIGEHTFNVDIWDMGQEAYLYMAKKWQLRFAENSLDIADLIREPQYRQCESQADNNYELWECYESVWARDRRNSRRSSDRSSIKWTFFNPIGAGFTYGYGQLGPERALRITDLVARVSGFPQVSVDNPNALYDAVLNPKTAIHYVAASNRVAIEIYRKYANFDISYNPGVMATLYNLGEERSRALQLRQKNLKSIASLGRGLYPEVNFYGWFVNTKENELRSAYESALSKLRCP